MSWLAVFIGGGIGSLMRYGTSALVNRNWSGHFPLATFFANFFACLLLGFSLLLLKNRVQHNELLYAFLVIGVCGGYSTFSTFAKENLELVEKGYVLIAIANILVSLLLCAGVLWMLRK